jgi:cation diffusion facilitator CzcD-associated flavoprotein CzcO
MKLRTHNWKPHTPDFVTHDVLATYIQDTAASNDILPSISFRTRVNKVEKRENKWEVSTSKLVDGAGEKEIRNTVQVCAICNNSEKQILMKINSYSMQ